MGRCGGARTQRTLVLNDLRATALAWSSFTAVAEADFGFSRNHLEQQILSDWTNHDDAITDDQALQLIDDSIEA
jgi:hypothetical protein